MTKKKLLKALAVAAITTSLVACSNSNSKNDDSSATVESSAVSSASSVAQGDSDVTANASYTIGYGMGASLEADKNIQAYGLNKDKVVSGFEDAMNSKTPQISQDEIAENMNALRENIQKKANEQSVSSFLKVRDSIYNSDLTPKSDVKNPSVVVYEFFDYQCMYCSKVAPEIEKIMADNKNVQVVFAEFPIFGERSQASEYAAEVGTAIYKLYGSDAYVKYHNGIFATGEDEGKLQNSTIDKVAVKAGAKMDDVNKAIKDDKIDDHLKDTLKMGFEDLNIQGTPYLIVTPAKGADANNTTVIGGYTDANGIQAAIDKAQSSGSNQEAASNNSAPAQVINNNDSKNQTDVAEA